MYVYIYICIYDICIYDICIYDICWLCFLLATLQKDSCRRMHEVPLITQHALNQDVLGMPGQSGTAHLGKMSLSQAPGLLVFTENT